MDYTAYALAADPNGDKFLTKKSQSKVKFRATFPEKYCSVNQRQTGEPFVMKFSIEVEEERGIMINRVAPIIGLQSAIDREIASGLPCIAFREVGPQDHPRKQPVFSLRLDLFYLEDYRKREKLSPCAFNPGDFKVLGLEGYEGEYILNQPFEYLQSRVVCGIMSPGQRYCANVAPLEAPGCKGSDGSSPIQQHQIQTVPVELELSPRAVFTLIQ
ncbi:hypothetical protein H2204_010441 [Knufia peltigerae]|uniref:Uncharacterized protein n=1 Tax=Knufia peltigerae TaxID=1002370 RepID=A0AA39CUX2_9EURO|nr:hypothetical protein H2204_010441 [Knufia peltigerae]